jgi:hypothetical protein
MLPLLVWSHISVVSSTILYAAFRRISGDPGSADYMVLPTPSVWGIYLAWTDTVPGLSNNAYLGWCDSQI